MRKLLFPLLVILVTIVGCGAPPVSGELPDDDSIGATTQIVTTTDSEAGFEAEAESETVSEQTVTLYSIAAEDGNARQGGITVDYFALIVGDDINNQPAQAFLSFDISGIPSDAIVGSASLDLSGVSEIGQPFAALGLLRVYNDQYGSLYPDDFTGHFFTGHMGSYSLPSSLMEPLNDSALTSAVQTKVNDGESRFQVRLQFEKHSNYDSKTDVLTFTVPELVVTYQD